MVNGDCGGLWDTAQVADVVAAIKRAEKLDATVVVPLVDNGQIELAHFAGPQ